jgi:hypothetical protein
LTTVQLTKEQDGAYRIIKASTRPISTAAVALELKVGDKVARDVINGLWEDQLVGRIRKGGVEFWHSVDQAAVTRDAPPKAASVPTAGGVSSAPTPLIEQSYTIVNGLGDKPNRPTFELRQVTIRGLAEIRESIVFPKFQRDGDVWGTRKRTLLVDSIMRGVDLPKFYFYETGEHLLSCIDGRQRLSTIFGLFDGDVRVDSRYWKDFDAEEKRRFLDHELTFSVIKGADEEQLSTIFLRLQLGTMLSPGEKLAAEISPVQDWLAEISKSPIFGHLGLYLNRKASQLLATKLASITYDVDTGEELSSMRYDSLRYFIKRVKTFDREDPWVQRTEDTLRRMESAFGVYATALDSQADVSSAYTLFLLHPHEAQSKLKDAVLEFVAKAGQLKSGVNISSINSKDIGLLQRYNALSLAHTSNTGTGVKQRADILEEFFLKSQRKGGASR